jgi:hypothetical protein
LDRGRTEALQPNWEELSNAAEDHNAANRQVNEAARKETPSALITQSARGIAQRMRIVSSGTPPPKEAWTNKMFE